MPEGVGFNADSKAHAVGQKQANACQSAHRQAGDRHQRRRPLQGIEQKDNSQHGDDSHQRGVHIKGNPVYGAAAGHRFPRPPPGCPQQVDGQRNEGQQAQDAAQQNGSPSLMPACGETQEFAVPAIGGLVGRQIQGDRNRGFRSGDFVVDPAVSLVVIVVAPAVLVKPIDSADLRQCALPGMIVIKLCAVSVGDGAVHPLRQIRNRACAPAAAIGDLPGVVLPQDIAGGRFCGGFGGAFFSRQRQYRCRASCAQQPGGQRQHRQHKGSRFDRQTGIPVLFSHGTCLLSPAYSPAPTPLLCTGGRRG